MKQTIKINKLSPSLNEWQRMHWGKRSKIKKLWHWLIKEQKPTKHGGSVIITYTRVSTQPMDLDGVGGSFKAIGDALVKEGIIEDDNPAIVTELRLRWEKSQTLKAQKSVIKIEDDAACK
jgi:hypothetical protein